MSIPCVLIMPEDSLLNQALINIVIDGMPAVNVITSEANDFEGLIAEISDLKPDTVLLRESTESAAEDYLTHLLMAYHDRLRVIVVSEDSNWLHIFRKDEMLLKRSNDLLDILNSD